MERASWPVRHVADWSQQALQRRSQGLYQWRGGILLPDAPGRDRPPSSHRGCLSDPLCPGKRVARGSLADGQRAAGPRRGRVSYGGAGQRGLVRVLAARSEGVIAPARIRGTNRREVHLTARGSWHMMFVLCSTIRSKKFYWSQKLMGISLYITLSMR